MYVKVCIRLNIAHVVRIVNKSRKATLRDIKVNLKVLENQLKHMLMFYESSNGLKMIYKCRYDH